MNKLFINTIYALTISNALNNAFESTVKPEMIAIANIALYIISAVLLIVLIVKGLFVWKDYRQGGDVQWGTLLVVFICLVISVSAPSWIWGVIGWQ